MSKDPKAALDIGECCNSGIEKRKGNLIGIGVSIGGLHRRVLFPCLKEGLEDRIWVLEVVMNNVYEIASLHEFTDDLSGG